MRRAHGALGALAVAAFAAALAAVFAFAGWPRAEARARDAGVARTPVERVRRLAAEAAEHAVPAASAAVVATPVLDVASETAVHDGVDPTRDASLLWPRLDPSDQQAGSLTARVAGHDPAGPRELVLYARGAAGAHALARTTSDADGRFDFGQLAQPNDGLALVVTALGGDPLAPTPLDIDAGALPPPQLSSFDDAGALVLSVHPALLAGELLLVDGGGRVLERIAVARSPELLRLDAVAAADSLVVVHRLPDGREAVALAAAPAP